MSYEKHIETITNIEKVRKMKRKNEMKDLINSSLETEHSRERVLKICEENDIHSITDLIVRESEINHYRPISFKKIKKKFLILRECDFYKSCYSCFDFIPKLQSSILQGSILQGSICKDCCLHLEECQEEEEKKYYEE